MKRNALLLLAGLLAVGLIAAGCGDDDDDRGDGGDALTKQEFIAQADAICTREDKEVDQAAAQLGENASQAEQQEFFASTAGPSIQGQIDQIGDLEASEADEEQVNAFLDSAQKALDQVEANPSLLFEGGQDADPFAEVSRLGTEFGFKDCAQ